jgi:hypothetical protein
VAIPLTSEFAPALAALIDGDQTLIVELRQGDPEPVDWVREADDSAVARATVSAGGGRKGKRAEYRCAACGYGIVVHEPPPSCPMCSEARWEHVEWRPFSQLLDDLALPARVEASRIEPPTDALPDRQPAGNHRSGASWDSSLRRIAS